MKTFASLADWQAFRSRLKGSIGFVPTMGALHAGHMALVHKALSENGTCVVSIFVNPTQFNSADDLDKYPRSMTLDLELLRQNGCHAVLLPSYDEIYADNYRFKITENQDAQILCGAHRPGHFSGVLTVVLKLLNLVQPQNCYMGEKDYQQLKLVQDMAQALFLRTAIVPCPTVRETDGLALSSRNLRLSPAAREKAPLIYRLLQAKSCPLVIRSELEAAGFNVDYVEEHWGRRFVAATIEGVRLIDNVKI